MSTDSQTGRDGDVEGYSIPAQRESATRKAKDLGADVVAEFSDPGISGRTDKRPVLQALLRRIQADKDIDYVHYLKGSIFCQRCLARYSITYANGNGGIYPYFFCLGRATGNGCDQPYLPVDPVEENVARFYGTLELEADVAVKLRSGFGTQLKEDRKRIASRSTLACQSRPFIGRDRRGSDVSGSTMRAFEMEPDRT